MRTKMCLTFMLLAAFSLPPPSALLGFGSLLVLDEAPFLFEDLESLLPALFLGAIVL